MRNDPNTTNRTTTGRGIDARAGATRLERLGDLGDYKVASGEPDIRGWDVVAADNTKIGEVHDLLVDTAAMKVRYLDVDLDRKNKSLNLREDRHVLIPIGAAQLNDDRDDVRLPTVQITQFATLPAYDHRPLTREHEREILAVFGSGTAATTKATTADTHDDFYGHERFDDQRFWGKRRPNQNAEYLTRSEEELAVGTRTRKAGEVGVHKHVETEHVKKEVPVTREEVTVERRPASGMRAGQANIRGDEEIRVPISEEEVVVEKRAVPKEEVVIKKTAKQDTKTVEADVRKERIDVDRDVDRGPRR